MLYRDDFYISDIQGPRTWSKAKVLSQALSQ